MKKLKVNIKHYKCMIKSGLNYDYKKMKKWLKFS